MKKIFIIYTFIFSLQIVAQQEDAWIFLKDKPSSATFLASPLTMLSQRSLDRRTRQNIALDNKDIPLGASYYRQIKAASGITVLAKSKWLNAIHIQGAKADIDALKISFSFVNRIEFANKSLNTGNKKINKKPKRKYINKFEEIVTDFNYGRAANQIEMLKGDFLHKQGYTGRGMQIAVLDGGFINVNTLNAFARIRNNNQILGGYNFVKRNENFYSGGNHGTNVLSDIAGYIDGEFVGTAPDASFYLFITEDGSREVPLEESLWVEAAERADSLGVDIINTSLGYTTFDNSDYDYTYADMNGRTTFISRGAEIGVSRGMILVNSAGNSGGNSWKYIGAPADAVSVFSVGAVNASRIIASFSSFGPTSDGRVKPDVLAQGQNVYVINHRSGNPKTSAGTSFSSPVIAGAIACFWQAFPNKNYSEVMDIIRKSSDRFDNPTAQYGYGIPNFENAYNTTLFVSEFNIINNVRVYPNPVKNRFAINISGVKIKDFGVKIFNILGKKVYQQEELSTNIIDVHKLSSGMYFLQITDGDKQKTIKLIKE